MWPLHLGCHAFGPMWSLADYFTNADYVVVLLGQVVPVAHNGIGTFTHTYGIRVGPYPSKDIYF